MLHHLVRRPIAVIMTFLGLVIIGIALLDTVPVSLLPDVPIPTITVQISHPGTSARELENTAVRPVRNQLMQVGHLRDISSRTHNHQATIDLTLEQNTDTDLAFLEVNEKIDQIISLLPREMARPKVIKINISDIPVYYLSVFAKDTGQNLDLELSDFSRSVLKRRIEQLPEVAFVDRTGYVEPRVMIIPDELTMNSLGFTEQELESALKAGNLNLGSIILKDGQYQYHVEFDAELNTVEEIASIYLSVGDQVIQMKDLATVQATEITPHGRHLYNGRPAILFTIRKQANAQLYDLKASFDTLLKQMKKDYPQLDFSITNDQSNLLDVSVRNLSSSLLFGGIMAFLIMFLFFREWKAPLYIGVAIPIALIIAVTGFYLTDLSINIISLAGLILGVGLMVDNAIITIENIRQFRMRGEDYKASAATGAEEVIRPLISSALTTCSVFLPLVFLSGLGGALFRDQAISVTLALASSLIVAYFLLPVLLSLGKNKKYESEKSNHLIWFRKSVDWVLSRKIIVCSLFFALLLSGIFILNTIEKKTFPELTRNALSVEIDWNEPLTVGENISRIQNVLSAFSDGIAKSNALVGEKQFLLQDEEQSIQEASMILFLIENKNVGDLAQAIEQFVRRDYVNAVIRIAPLENLFDKIFSSKQSALVAQISSNQENIMPAMNDINLVAAHLKRKNIILDPPAQQQEYLIRVKLDQTQLYEVDHLRVYEKIKTLLNAYEVIKMRTTDQYVPVVLGSDQRSMYDLLAKATVRNRKGKTLPVQSFVQINKTQAPKTITAGKGGESLNFSFDSYSDVLVQDIKEAVSLTGRHLVSFSGQYFENRKIIKELSLIMLVSLFLLFLILAAQFESLWQPLVVMLTVPVSLAGSVTGLYLLGESVNIIAIIGMIVTMGIVVNDAILKIDMINRARKSSTIVEAIHTGGERRLRPIIMTSLTTILALIPILFATGLGAELQRPLAVAVMFGLSLGTLASLYFVPVVYSLLSIGIEK